MASTTAKESFLFNAAGTLVSLIDSESELGVGGLGSAIMRGFEPFRLLSTSVPIVIGVGRSGTGENSSNVFDFTGDEGVRECLVLMSYCRASMDSG